MARRSSSFALLVSLSLLLLGLGRIVQWSLRNIKFLEPRLLNRSSPSRQAHDHYVCNHSYTVEIMSFDPWVLYVNDFVKEEGLNIFFQLRKKYRPSSIFRELTIPTREHRWFESEVYRKSSEKDSYRSRIDKELRSSWSAFIPEDDKVSICLSKRLKKLLGNVQHEDTERLQLVRYDGGERFRLHQDWINPRGANHFNSGFNERPFNRLISSFIYLQDDCTGGETYFPRLQGVGPSSDGTKFSMAENGQGLLFKPKRGNAVLWENMHMNGTGDGRVLHASLPVKSGRKIGMNLFSL